MEREWALITGASSGIGLAYANELASRGFNLVIVSNEEKAIEEKAALLIKQHQVEVLPLYRDLAIPGAAEELYTYCQTKGIKIEVLVNNAGMFYFNEVVEENAKKTEKMLYLHVITTTQLCYFFGKEMKQRRHGHILNMSSMSAWIPFPGIALYASTKDYLKDFSKALRAELRVYNVNVTVLCPGAVATNLYNLSDNLKLLAIRLGIMMRPEKLAKKGINALFKRRCCIMPGHINKIATPFVMLLPYRFVRWLMHKVNLLPYMP